MKNKKVKSDSSGQEKTCYIIGAGDFYGELSPKAGDLIIAADGGFDTLKSMGITPDLLIGDMDSIEAVAKIEKIVFPVRKDETDTFLAYREGVKRGYTDFVILGGVGGRDDHTFANFSLLIYAKNRDHSIKMIGERCEIFAIKNERIELSGTPEAHLSAFAFGGDAKGVTICGLEYDAENLTLTPEFPLAVSNRFTEKDASIEVKDGTLLIMAEYQK